MIDKLLCPKCGCLDWGLSNTGMPNALECLDCGEVYSAKGEWVEITKGQIDDCLKHSDNYDFAWAIEAMCKKNNGY